MSQDVSGFGLRVTLTASNTYPQGIVLTSFADDADPFDFPSMQIGDSAMGVNGDLVKWSKANPVKVTLNLIPGTEDDLNLEVLGDANRVGRGRSSAQDDITMVGVYPDGRVVTARGGLITDYVPGRGVSSAGRQKSRPYMFTFEDLARA